MTVGTFITGIIIVVIGFFLVWKANWLMINMGRIAWAEAHLGTEGGSRTLYKILGVLIIFFGFMYAFDLTDNILSWAAVHIFNQKIPENS